MTVLDAIPRPSAGAHDRAEVDSGHVRETVPVVLEVPGVTTRGEDFDAVLRAPSGLGGVPLGRYDVSRSAARTCDSPLVVAH